MIRFFIKFVAYCIIRDEIEAFTKQSEQAISSWRTNSRTWEKYANYLAARKTAGTMTYSEFLWAMDELEASPHQPSTPVSITGSQSIS
jgi:hypothetical protein